MEMHHDHFERDSRYENIAIRYVSEDVEQHRKREALRGHIISDNIVFFGSVFILQNNKYVSSRNHSRRCLRVVFARRSNQKMHTTRYKLCRMQNNNLEISTARSGRGRRRPLEDQAAQNLAAHVYKSKYASASFMGSDGRVFRSRRCTPERDYLLLMGNVISYIRCAYTDGSSLPTTSKCARHLALSSLCAARMRSL